MRTRSMLLAAAVLAALALAMAIGSASASRLSVDEPSFTAVWHPITFFLGEHPVRCNLTLNGSFSSRTFTKTSGVKARSVGEINYESCTGGGFRLLSEEFPWEFIYESFTGALPRIQEVNFGLRPVGFQIEIEPFTCRIVSGLENEPAKASFRLGEGMSVRELVLPRTGIAPIEGEIACAAQFGHGYVSGTATITRPRSAELIHITLI